MERLRSLPAAKAKRLHFLDWLRALGVWGVVYGHLNFCGLAEIYDTTVDNHAYGKDPNTLAVRYASITRPWLVPLLFWISGAASALSFKGEAPVFLKGVARIAMLTLVGVCSNGAMWLLGPRDERCSINRPCPGKGILFDFTEDPFEGDIEPFFNQMWFTAALILVMLVNWPFCKVVCGRASSVHLLIPFAITSALYFVLVQFALDDCKSPGSVLIWLVLCEAAFMSVTAMAVSMMSLPWYIPLRLLQYICAGIAVVQLGIPELTPLMTGDVSGAYVLFMAVSCNRWFGLGFLMTRPRRLEADSDAKPLISQAWPVVLVPAVLFAPSTNWIMAGILTYPYYQHALDRCLYLAGTFTMFFVIDRVSRSVECIPLPRVINISSVVLFVFQITFITFLLHFGLRSIIAIWMLATVAAIAIAAIYTNCSSVAGLSDPRLERQAERTELVSNDVSS